MSAPRYKNPLLRQTYTKALETARAGAKDLFKADGSQRRGSSQACAFWDGYNGSRSPIAVPGSMSGACFQAGKQFRRESDKPKRPWPVEMQRRILAALQLAEPALAEGDQNCGGGEDNVFHEPLLKVRAAIAQATRSGT